jgi:hypothetical protein
MVRHWRRERGGGWKRSAVVNGTGAVATAVVFLVIMEAKFAEGAWVVIILIPCLATICWLIGRFYRALRRSLHVAPEAVLDLAPKGKSRVPIVVPIEDINLAAVMTLGAACERSMDVTAVHVTLDPDTPSDVAVRWAKQFPNLPLVVIDSPFRTAADPIAVYVEDRLRAVPHEVVVMVPVVSVQHWYQRALVNQNLKRLKKLLARRRQVQVVDFPFGSTPSIRKLRPRPRAG